MPHGFKRPAHDIGCCGQRRSTARPEPLLRWRHVPSAQAWDADEVQPDYSLLWFRPHLIPEIRRPPTARASASEKTLQSARGKTWCEQTAKSCGQLQFGTNCLSVQKAMLGRGSRRLKAGSSLASCLGVAKRTFWRVEGCNLELLSLQKATLGRGSRRLKPGSSVAACLGVAKRTFWRGWRLQFGSSFSSVQKTTKPTVWGLEGCNLELAPCQFRKRR